MPKSAEEGRHAELDEILLSMMSDSEDENHHHHITETSEDENYHQQIRETSPPMYRKFPDRKRYCVDKNKHSYFRPFSSSTSGYRGGKTAAYRKNDRNVFQNDEARWTSNINKANSCNNWNESKAYKNSHTVSNNRGGSKRGRGKNNYNRQNTRYDNPRQQYAVPRIKLGAPEVVDKYVAVNPERHIDLENQTTSSSALIINEEAENEASFSRVCNLLVR